MFATLSFVALAAAASPPCAAISDAGVPVEFAGWAARQPMTAAARTAEAAPGGLTPGHAVRLSLKPAAALAYPIAPNEKDAGGFGGLVPLTITAAATYRIAAGGAAWIELVRDGQAVASNAHTHGPACSSVRKIVDFPLTPGRYLVQVSGSAAPTLDLMAVRKP